MKELQAWFDRRAQSEQHIPSVEGALLSGRFAEYALYRLRLFFLRTLAATAVHALRLTLLWAAFSRTAFLQLLLFEAAVGFASSFWWGALESMRDEIRRLHRSGRTHLVPREIERWLTLGWTLAAGVMIACVVWLAFRSGPFGAVQLYAVALFVRLAMLFVTRTFHSGVYALRRIYRPAWAVVGVELVSFGAVAAAWPVAGVWALPVGTLVSSVAAAALTIYFTQRLYRFLGLAPRWCVPRTLRGRWRISWIQLLAAGLAFSVMKLDAILVFGLFGPRDAAIGQIELFVLLFVMSPTIQAGFDWSQLFYFDLKRLESAPLAPLLEQYRRYVARLGWVLGLAFWLLGSLTGTVVYLRSLGVLYVWLGPFFVARSLAASAQIRAFCDRQYGALLGTASLWLVAFAIATHVSGEAWKLAIVTVATMVVPLALSRVTVRGAAYQERYVGIVEWLHLLSAVQAPVRVRSATIRPSAARKRDSHAPRGLSWAHRQFVRRLAAQLAEGSAITLVPPDRIVWFEPAATRPLRAQTVAWLSGGVAQSVHETGAHTSGLSAVSAAWGEHGLEAVFGRMELESIQHLSLAELEARFAQQFPDGWMFRPGHPAATAATMPPRWRRQVIREAKRFLSDLDGSRDRSPLDVTALCVGGRVRLLFVVGRNGRSEPRRRWRAAIRRANVLAAIGAVTD